jgi:hypothetical protein
MRACTRNVERSHAAANVFEFEAQPSLCLASVALRRCIGNVCKDMVRKLLPARPAPLARSLLLKTFSKVLG